MLIARSRGEAALGVTGTLGYRVLPFQGRRGRASSNGAAWHADVMGMGASRPRSIQDRESPHVRMSALLRDADLARGNLKSHDFSYPASTGKLPMAVAGWPCFDSTSDDPRVVVPLLDGCRRGFAKCCTLDRQPSSSATTSHTLCPFVPLSCHCLTAAAEASPNAARSTGSRQAVPQLVQPVSILPFSLGVHDQRVIL